MDKQSRVVMVERRTKTTHHYKDGYARYVKASGHPRMIWIWSKDKKKLEDDLLIVRRLEEYDYIYEVVDAAEETDHC